MICGVEGPAVVTSAVNLHNAVTVSQQCLGKRVAQLSPARMNEVCAALRFSLACDEN
jgi:mRNA-degrading endonuclease toxin of MazEF toxin-antitoxin module